ncbi:MAG: hypothetical protein U9O24_07740 [Campylobacterota bacterium]|nr:hypothetical protein [Campylobacterota bacterium]
MKKSTLFLTLAALFMVGCGSDSDKKVTLPKPVIVYDFSEFIVPTENKSYIYAITTYEKNDDSEYEENSELSYYDREYNYENNSTIIITDDFIDQKIVIAKNEITIENLFEEQENIFLDRNVSVGDVILSMRVEEARNDLDGVNNVDCTITKYLDEKIIAGRNVSNILEQTCISEFNATLDTGFDNLIREDKLKTVTYFSKDIGEVSFSSELCILIKTGDTITTDNCTKVESELVTNTQ